MSTIIKREGDVTYYSGNPKLRELEAEVAELEERIAGMEATLIAYYEQDYRNGLTTLQKQVLAGAEHALLTMQARVAELRS